MFVVQRYIKSPIAWLLVLMLFSSRGIAANGAVNVDDSGIAIHGHDPVAYFVLGEATPGKSVFSVEWSGATWLFANAEHRQMFLDDPMRYAPRFGGFCAYAASYGQFADIDPRAWSIVNGRLYLNFSLRVREIWLPRADEFIADAEQLWPTMRP